MYYITAGASETVIYEPGITSIIEPVLTRVVNKSGELTFKVLPDSDAYDYIQKLNMPITCHKDDEVVFFGRALSDEKDFYNIKTVRCEGALTFLHDAPCEPFMVEYSGQKTVERFIRFILDQYNSKVDEWKRIYCGNIEIDSERFVRYSDTVTADIYEALMDRTVSSPLGGIIRARRESGKTYLDYLRDAVKVSDQSIMYGVNLLDLAQQENAEKVYTIIVPYGETNEETGERLTIEAVNNGKKYLESETGIEKYGRIWLSVEYESIKNAPELKARALSDLSVGINGEVSITVSAADLSLIGEADTALEYGDRIPVISHPHGIDGTFLCEQETIYLDNPGASLFQFGSPATFTSQHVRANTNVAYEISGIAEQSQANTESIKAATETINAIESGQLSGTVFITKDAGTYTGTVEFETAFYYLPQLHTRLETEGSATLTTSNLTVYGFDYSITINEGTNVEVYLNWLAKV